MRLKPVCEDSPMLGSAILSMNGGRWRIGSSLVLRFPYIRMVNRVTRREVADKPLGLGHQLSALGVWQ